ncbi:MAG: hypothetical protein H7329_20590 [Opitutaceae bacterium]|nr:hypothetical protein [Cytophagales bacterium]
MRIKYSSQSGLIKGAVTSKFFKQLPSVVSLSGQGPNVISSILDRINDEIFPPVRTLRYFLSEISPDAIRFNVNQDDKMAFKNEMRKR